MKVLCDLNVQVSAYSDSDISWIDSDANFLFVIEQGKKLRVLSIEQDSAKEVQSASVSDPCRCTSLSWDKNASLLAIVLDKRQVYFLEINTNAFTQFKEKKDSAKLVRAKSRDIEFVAWSKLSERLAICYSTGQILLSEYNPKLKDSQNWEEFIDNGMGVLNRIVAITVSDHVDLFACLSSSNEVLVMCFNGQLKFYLQGQSGRVFNLKFSPVYTEYNSGAQSRCMRSIWVSYQSYKSGILLKHINVEPNNVTDTPPRFSTLSQGKELEPTIVDYFWLSSRHIIACSTTGAIFLLDILPTRTAVSLEVEPATQCEIIFRVPKVADEVTEENSKQSQGSETFKIFELVEDKSRDVHVLVAATDYELSYYEVSNIEADLYSIDQVTSLNLESCLRKIDSRLQRIKLSRDCSLLAVQLSSGLVIVYRALLPSHLLASFGSKVAYLSATKEVTLIDYGPGKPYKSLGDETNDDRSDENAFVINIDTKPSAIAIGPNYLALACNNRVRFYSIRNFLKDSTTNEFKLSPRNESELEYANVISKLALNSSFVAVLFEDSRLKLHPIRSTLSRPATNDDSIDQRNEPDDIQLEVGERYFPDPSKPEKLTGFALTEGLLVYCNTELCLTVFSLKEWTIIQTCDCSLILSSPIEILRPNNVGNKFACLSRSKEKTNESNVNLYDLYTNKMLPIVGCEMFQIIFRNQLGETIKLIPFESEFLDRWLHNELGRISEATARFSNVQDAIWDTDGRTLLLIERKKIHTVGVLDHTICSNTTIVEYATSSNKPVSYKILYASLGVISCQTSSGGLANLIVESQDDELNLVELEQHISSIGSELDEALSSNSSLDNKQLNVIEAHAKIMQLKLTYLRSILPIYSLTRCQEICEHVSGGEQFKLQLGHLSSTTDASEQRVHQSISLIDGLIWRQLAAWAIYTSNLDFALLVYRKHRLLVHAQVLATILARLRRDGVDSKPLIEQQLLELLNCEPN